MKNKLFALLVLVAVFTVFNRALDAQDTAPLPDASTIVMDDATLPSQGDALIDSEIMDDADAFAPSQDIGGSDGVDDTDFDDEHIYITDPIIIAVASGDIEKIAEFIAQDGIGVNYAESVLGLTPLIIAVSCGHESVVKFLLEQPGIEVNKPMNDGLSPLLCAVMQNNSAILTLLLAMPGMEVANADEYGNTAESLAADAGYAECLALLQNFVAA